MTVVHSLAWVSTQPITEVIKNQDEDLKPGSYRIYLKLLKETRQEMNRSMSVILENSLSMSEVREV